MSDSSHIHSIETWDSGGGIELEVVELVDGLTFVITDEVVTVYPSADDFWEDANKGSDSHHALVINRETGRSLEFAR